MADALRFTASVAQVKTMADGGIRLALDLSETDIDIAAAMMQAKQAGAALEIAAIPISNIIVKQQVNNAIQKRPKRKSEWTPQERPGDDGSA